MPSRRADPQEQSAAIVQAAAEHLDPARHLVYRAEATGNATPIALPADFDAGRHRGYLFGYVLRPDSGQNEFFVSYWQSREHFEREGVALCRTLGLTVTATGWVSATAKRIASRSERFRSLVRRPTALVAFAATLAALYGNAEALANGVRTIFERPVCELTTASRVPRNVLVSPAGADLAVEIVNLSAVNARVRLTRSEVEGPAGGLRLANEAFPRLPRLGENRSGTIPLQVVASAPGDYTLRLHAECRNDWRLGRSAQWEIRVVAWQPHAGRVVACEPGADGAACIVTYELQIGQARERGLRVSFRLRGVPGIAFRDDVQKPTALPGAIETYQVGGEGRHHLARIDYVTLNRVPAFASYRFVLPLLADSPRSGPAWSEIVRRLELLVLDPD